MYIHTVKENLGNMASPVRLCYTLVTLLLFLSVSGAEVECPPWFILEHSNSSTFPLCVCSDALEIAITCKQRERTSFLKIGHCAFQDVESNQTVVGSCPYVFPTHLIHDGFIRLPEKLSELNSFICGHLKREIRAPLCGRCTNGTGPSIYSIGSQCVSCSKVNILYYLLLQYVPTTIMFLVIIVFRVHIVSAPMAHYVLYCNFLMLCSKANAGFYILSAIINRYALVFIRISLTLISLLTFDPLLFVSPPLCISESISEIYIPVFDTLAALYPFTLLLLTYIGIELHARDFKPIVLLWRPFKGNYERFIRSWDPNKSLIQVLATLFFLSFTKFLIITYEAFNITRVFNMQSELVTRVSYIDPTVIPYSHKHMPLLFLSVIILIFIVLPPTILLAVYPTRCFRKVSTCLKPRWLIAIHIFVDTFQGCYKDGTNGTRDYRAISGYILAVSLAIPLLDIPGVLSLFTGHSYVTLFWQVPIIFLTALSITCVVLEPYKHRAANLSGAILPVTLAVAGSIESSLNTYKVSTPVILLWLAVYSCPHFVFYGYGIFWLAKRLKQCATAEHGEEGAPLLNTTGDHSRV